MTVSLPLTLAGSFFSQRGLETLHKKLDAHDAEDAALARFFKQRSAAYHAMSSDLSNSLLSEESAKGFSIDEGASLKAAFFRGLQEADIAAQSRLYKHVAQDLDLKLVEPYERYVDEYATRKQTSRKTLQGHIQAYDKALLDLDRIKTAYHRACTKADHEADEARFHALDPDSVSQPSTASPRSASYSSPSAQPKPAVPPLQIPDSAATPPSKRSPQALMSPEDGDLTPREPPPPPPSSSVEPQQHEKPAGGVARKATVADRLRALTKDSVAAAAESSTPPPSSALDSDGLLDIAGVVNGTKQWSSFFQQAEKDLPKRSLKIPLWGVYENLVTGQDLVAYFKENLVALESDYARSFEFCRQLAEELYLIRLIGEFGNKFSDDYDAYYQFKPEIFHLDDMKAAEPPAPKKELPSDGLTKLPGTASPRLRPSSPDSAGISDPNSANGDASAASLIKRSTTVLNTISSRFAPSSPGLRLQKLRAEAQETESAYRKTVRRAEVLRLTADQQTQAHLHFLHRLELDRLRFLKATLKRFQDIVQPAFPQALNTQEDANLMVEAMQPEADLQAICEMYRVTTGYRPQPVIFIDHYGEQLDANFGVDLHRWEETQLHQGKKLADITVPPVLTALLARIQEGYPTIPNAKDRRRIWYLDVPLSAVNALRTALNDGRKADTVPTNLLNQTDIPVAAAVVKLFFLELDPPVITYNVHERLHTIYPQVAGSASHDDKADEAGRIERLKELLSHLPKVNLLTLDALLKHLRQLIQDTADAEGVDTEDLFLAKIGHSMGRCITRPKIDTSITLNDRAPAYLLADLVHLRDEVLPPTIEKRTQMELDRFKPKRRRTRPVDLRLSRTSVGSVDSAQAHELLSEQLQQKEPQAMPRPSDSPSPVPEEELQPVQKETALPEAKRETLETTPEPEPVVEADRSTEVDADAEGGAPAPNVEPLAAVAAQSMQAPPRPPRRSLSPPKVTTSYKNQGEKDAPFEIPTDAEASSLNRSASSGSSPSSPTSAGLGRAPRVKGPKVAQAAQRFSMPPDEAPRAARLSRSFNHRKSNSSAGSSPRS